MVEEKLENAEEMHLNSVWQRWRTGVCRLLLIANVLASC